MRNLYIAAAVAASLGAASAQAAPPSLAACQGATQIYVAGSSAAQTAIVNALSDTLFSPGNYTIFTGAKPANNFIAVCGVSQVNSGTNLVSGNTYLMNYRFEGGSVVGVLPVATGKSIKFLDISAVTVTDSPLLTAYTISGFTGGAANRSTDSFGVTAGTQAKFQSHIVEIGISDVEPSLLTGSNYPSFYSATVFGSATTSQMNAVKALGTQVFQQGFGIFVNGSITGATYPLKLSKATIGQILRGEVSDWSHVVDINGNPVTATSQSILIKNREKGSGSRASTDVYFNQTGCGGVAGAILNTPNASDFASTGDVLKAVNSIAGAITYASLNNDPNTSNNGGGGVVNGTNNNLSVVWIDGIGNGSGLPTTASTGSGATGGGTQDANWSQLIAAQRYDFFTEAYAIGNPAGSAVSQDFYTYLVPVLQAVGTAPHTAQVVAINGLNGNSVPSWPTLVSDAGTTPRDTTIYVNAATRNGKSCSAPVGTAF
jgi:hypothetical protein